MAVGSAPVRPPRTRPGAPRRRRRRWPFVVLGVAILVLGAAVAAALTLSGAHLQRDDTALARVDVEPLGGSLREVRATDAAGRAIGLRSRDGALIPLRRVRPGERIAVRVTVRRPGWSAWLLGDTRTERLTVRAPVATPTSRYVTVGRGAPVRVPFDGAVASADYTTAGSTAPHRAHANAASVAIASSTPAGSVRIAAAARPWERLGKPTTVHWFPRMSKPVALVSPSPSGALSPADPVRITFSQPVEAVLGSKRPALSPRPLGHWRTADSHTLVFTPSGYGVGLDTHERLTLPRAVEVADSSGDHLRVARSVDWTVPAGSTLRLHQLLARAGYLPLQFEPDGKAVARTARAQLDAAVDPPKGHFSWRYANTPHELTHQWHAGEATAITRGAIMMFQDEHGLDVDALAGPTFWKTLISDTIHGKRHTKGYSYVYVHRDVPQLLTLWHAGHTVLTSPGNTGVPAAPTDLGTFGVFEHVASTTMSGTNPDGSSYNDPGVKWVSYFNGGDALHAFDRGSFGTPQSLGCVELPEASAKRVFPYTPIGTLVTVEH